MASAHDFSMRRPQAVGRRRPSKGDEREQALLACAEEFLKDGRFDDASIEVLARGAGISRPTFYFYFSSKQTLLARLIDRTMEQFVLDLHEVHRARGSDAAASAIRGALRATAKMWAQHGAVMAAVAEGAGSSQELFERIRMVNETGVDDVVKIMVAHGSTPEVSTKSRARETALLLAWMAERNFYVLARTRPTRKQLYALADRLASIWLRAAGIPDSE